MKEKYEEIEKLPTVIPLVRRYLILEAEPGPVVFSELVRIIAMGERPTIKLAIHSLIDEGLVKPITGATQGKPRYELNRNYENIRSLLAIRYTLDQFVCNHIATRTKKFTIKTLKEVSDKMQAIADGLLSIPVESQRHVIYDFLELDVSWHVELCLQAQLPTLCKSVCSAHFTPEGIYLHSLKNRPEIASPKKTQEEMKKVIEQHDAILKSLIEATVSKNPSVKQLNQITTAIKSHLIGTLQARFSKTALAKLVDPEVVSSESGSMLPIKLEDVI